MFNIVEKRKILFAVPCVIILAGIISFFIFGGLNTDIDFTGGTAMEIELGTKFNENAVQWNESVNTYSALLISARNSPTSGQKTHLPP